MGWYPFFKDLLGILSIFFFWIDGYNNIIPLICNFMGKWRYSDSLWFWLSKIKMSMLTCKVAFYLAIVGLQSLIRIKAFIENSPGIFYEFSY